MRRREILVLAVMLAVGATSGWLSGDSFAQEKSLNEQLVGTWKFVSAVDTRPDGTRFDPLGGNGAGTQSFASTGQFNYQILRSDTGSDTGDEFESMAQGVISYFGSYSLDDGGKMLTQHVESSSFPNFNGTDRKWAFTLSTDELTLSSEVVASGDSNELKWKRVK
jgi:Lipocalin-like domain